MLKAKTGVVGQKWKLTICVGIFLVASLGVSWMARRGALRAVLQRLSRNTEGNNVSAGNAGERPTVLSSNTSEIEVVDLNNQRWLVPIQAPTSHPPPTRRIANTGSAGAQQNTNSHGWELLPPVHSPRTAAEIKATPPAVTSSSNGPEKVLASSDTNEPREGIPVPPQSVTAEDTGLQPGELLRKVEPVYPPAALAQKVEGTVKIFAAIDAEGNVKTLQPLSGPRELIPAALDAVRQWHYSPTLLNGQPIETQRQITVVFRMATSP